MLDRENLFTLAKIVANANPSSTVAYSYNNENMSYNELADTLRDEIKELSSTYALYRENKNLIFALMEQVLDDVIPRRVIEQYSQFADIRQFAQGEKPIFVQKITEASRRRAKQFITRVGLAGVYEVFKLDGQSLEVTTSAFGGAAEVSIEEYLDGRVSLNDLLDIVLEGLDEAIYKEIMKAMAAATEKLQPANVYAGTSFVEAEMDKLIRIADSYNGGNATIYCTFEFAGTMVPSDGWVSDDMRNQKWNNGYLANYKGHRVVVLKQSYVDDTNTEVVLDPSCAYIFSGTNKPVLIALEGNTLIDERKNRDWSMEVQVYKKFGVATRFTNDMCVYCNESLKNA